MTTPASTDAAGRDRGAGRSLEGDAAPSRGDRKAETHERILRAAGELFTARGFRGTSVASVAQRAGVSSSAVLWHFGSKAALFQEICKELLQPFRVALEQKPEQPDPRARLFAIFEIFDEFAADHEGTIQALIRWTYGDPVPQASLLRELLAFHAAFVRDVQQTLAAAGESPEDAAGVGAALVSMLDGNLLLGLLDPTSPAVERRRHGLLTIARRILDAREDG